MPPDIAKGLATGELSTLGTTAVRNSEHITAHIKAVSRTLSDGKNPMAAAVGKSVKNPTFVIIGLGVVAAAAVGGGVAVWARSKEKQPAAELETPECVSNYNASLAAYLEAIGSGSLAAGLITRLISDLDSLKEKADSGAISLELSVEEPDKLVRLIADYTNKLADANSVEPSGLDDADSDSVDGVIIDIRRYLESQRQILDEVA
ncbi:hypothetical protein [Miltoncostaea marina]|uniref:hypothetical protein n=1 Tax=Miltoncostaea marina TaxID=2843215 RepID=UPI001C3CDF19|nr:hypothetical protein [Miltoncostaea marina]